MPKLLTKILTTMKVKVLKYELSDVIVPQIFEMTKGAFKMYVRSRFLNFDAPTPPLFVLVCFQAYPPPLPKVCSLWLELTLSPSICICVKFRDKKLIMSPSVFG